VGNVFQCLGYRLADNKTAVFFGFLFLGQLPGPFGSNLKHGEFVNKGIAVLGIDNAVNNYFSWKERRFITQEKYQELKQYRVFPRDVIITIMATIGRSAVIPGDIPIAINTKHLAAITVDEEKVNPYFLSYSIHSNPYILHQLKLHNQGAIMDGLNLGIIKELKMKLPPIKLQNEFEKKYHKLRTMEKLGTEVLVELDNLSNILIQKAFSGELIC
jgi:type I restriction enzyme S subunit